MDYSYSRSYREKGRKCSVSVSSVNDEVTGENSRNANFNGSHVISAASRKASSPYRSVHYDTQRAAPSQWQYLSPSRPPLELPHPALRKHNASPRYQPHQLVALCFNTLAGHDCEHCALLRHSMSHDHHSTASPDSTRTLSHHEADDEKQKDGGEKGGRSSGPPAPVGLFDKRLNATRLRIIGLWLRTVLILCTFILCVLSMYWAVLYRVAYNTSSLDVFVVDFDGTQAPFTNEVPLVGPMITQVTEKMLAAPEPHLGYITMNPASFDNDPLQVRQAIFDFKAYAAIVINANATGLLRQAVATGNASYDPLGACQQVWVEARDQDTYYDYVLPQLNALQTEITSSFGKMWTEMVLKNTSIPLSNLQAVPQALSPAIGFSLFSLRPFDPAVVTPAVTIGLIYLIIIAFFSFSFFLPIYMQLVTPEGHPPIKFYKLIIVRWLGANLAYFFMSLAYSFVSLAFQIPFSNSKAPDTSVSNNPDAYGHGTFVVYWMVNWVGMSALGLACENVAMIIGQPWTAMWLIFWVISNVSTSFYSLDLSPKWFYWGYAWPLHNIVEASRSLLFDLHSRIGLNFGVLFAWVAINSLLFPGCCYFMRWKMMKAKKAESKKQKP